MKKTAILLVYFSRSDSTRILAEQIHKRIGGDIFEIEPEEAYPTEYDKAVRRARQELDSGFRPALKTSINDVRQYNMIFIGYPIWWGTMPMPVFTFLSEYNFSGKFVVPFCTHGGSNMGRSVEDIKRLCPHSTILEGLAVQDVEAKKASSAISEWLRKLDMME